MTPTMKSLNYSFSRLLRTSYYSSRASSTLDGGLCSKILPSKEAISKNRSYSDSRENISNSKLMKAVVLKEFGKPASLSVTYIPKPVVNDTEVLIRVEAAGINPVDAHIRLGIYRQLPQLPAILGKEVAGVIEEIGGRASSQYNLKVGDRVFARLSKGGYAEYVSTHIDNVVPLPNRLTYSQGASLYVTYYTAYRALILRSKLSKSDKVLIHGGSGGVGTAALQILNHLGIEDIGATAGTSVGVELIRRLGAKYTFNHRQKDHLHEARSSMGGKGLDFILENAADLHLADDISVLAPKGSVAIVGCQGNTNISPRSLMGTEGRVYGINLGYMTKPELDECTRFLLHGIEEGWISPVVGREYPLGEAILAHTELILKMASRGNMVFRMDMAAESSPAVSKEPFPMPSENSCNSPRLDEPT